MKKLLLLLSCLQSALCGQALEFSKTGVLTAGNTEWGTLHMDAKWHPSFQKQSLSIDSSDAQLWSGSFLGARERPIFDYRQSIEPLGHGGVRLTAQAAHEAGFEANMLAYQGTLPLPFYGGSTVLLDGQPVLLPESYEGEQNIIIQQAREVQLPTAEGTLSFRGNYTVMIVDGRKFGGDRFYLRFFFDPHNGELRNSNFTTEIHFERHRFNHIPLQSAANRAFADPVAGDGRGGWTDQGPGNDLSTFDAGSELSGNIPFNVIKQGPSALVLSRQEDRSDKAFAQIQLDDPTPQAKYLYLLHASAYTWGTVGQIKVDYADGSAQYIDVEATRDVGNWWNPTAFANAALGWTGKTAEANIGLYISRFALEGKPVRSIAFGAAGEPIWMLVAATLSEARLPLPTPEYFEVTANETWQPIDVPLTVQPGSALDFSDWTEAPAGKHGPVVTTEDGHFAYAAKPDQPVRFWGTNLNFSANFPSHAEADALAKRLRQMGYNALRIHHYDVLLAGGWHPETYTIDPQKMDRLDYLFHALKEHGLYISTDLFTIRRIRNDALAEFNLESMSAFKALVPIHPAAMSEWKRFARDLLTHENPYTGMTWAEDPALFSIAPVNEDTIWAALNADPRVRALYDTGFEAWLEENPRSLNSEADRATAFNEFLAMVQIRSDIEMRNFLRNELGSTALVTGNNWHDYWTQTPVRAQYEYVDNHGYWDHPNFPQGPWKYPFSHSQRSATSNLAELPRRLFLTRVEDIPFTVTEFNYVYPNKFRSEGGALMGAYAALQDYDGLFRFSWAHENRIATSQQPAEGFDIAQDPINLLSEHIIGMLWRRGDMPVFEEEAVYVVNQERAFSAERLGGEPPSIANELSLLGLTRKVSVRYDPQADDSGLNQAFLGQKPRDRYEASAGMAKVILDKRGDFFATTPYSQVATVQQESLAPDFVSEVKGGPVTVLAGSLDHQRLAASKRILVLHLTNVLSEGMKFAEEAQYTILEKGSAKKLVKAGSARISIPQDPGLDEATVYAIALNGSRIAEVAYEIDSNGRLVFTAETVSEKRVPVLAYEIIR